MRIPPEFQDRFSGWLALEARTFIRISYLDHPQHWLMLVVWLAAKGCSRRAEALYELFTNNIIIVDNYARMAHIQRYYLRRRFPPHLDKTEKRFSL